MKKNTKVGKKTRSPANRKRPPHLLPSYSAVGTFPGNPLSAQTETRHKLWQLGNSACEGDALALQAIQSIASDAIDQLLCLAAGGSGQAIRRLIGSLRTTLRDLEEALAMRGQKFTEYARTQQEWPGLLSMGKAPEKGNAEMKKKLHLGLATGLDPDSKAFAVKAPGTLAAMRLKEFLENYRQFPRTIGTAHLPEDLTEPSPQRYLQLLLEASQLPPLSKDTAKHWWRTGRNFLPVLFGQEFQDHELLAELLGKERSVTSRARIRSEIRKRIEQGLHSIAARD